MFGLLRFLFGVVFSIALHVLAGWPWTLLAGIVTGAMLPRRGWLWGMLAVGAGWLVLIGYNFVADARAVSVMLMTVGGIMGNLPGVAVVGLTLLIGAILGLFGGIIGQSMAPLLLSPRTRHSEAPGKERRIHHLEKDVLQT